MRTLIKGEKRYIAMTVVHQEAAVFTIASCTFIVQDKSGTAVETGTATIAAPKVFMLLDTTKVGYVADKTYFVYFSVTITGMQKIIIDKVEVRVSRW